MDSGVVPVDLEGLGFIFKRCWGRPPLDKSPGEIGQPGERLRNYRT